MFLNLVSKSNKDLYFSGVVNSVIDIVNGEELDWDVVNELGCCYSIVSVEDSIITLKKVVEPLIYTDILNCDTIKVDLHKGIKDCVGYNKATLEELHGVYIPKNELGNYVISFV